MLWKLIMLVPSWILQEHEKVLEEYKDKPISWKQWVTETIILLAILAVIFL